MDCSPLGFSVHGIFQAGILEYVAIPTPGDLHNPGIEPGSLALQADSFSTLLSGKPHRRAKYNLKMEIGNIHILITFKITISIRFVRI